MTDYGVDMACGPLGLSTTRLVSGTATLRQDSFNLLRTPTGKLLGSRTASASGIDISKIIGQHGARSKVMLPAMITTALQRDARIRSARATVELAAMSAGMLRLQIRIDITPADGTSSFPLVVEAGPGLLRQLGAA